MKAQARTAARKSFEAWYGKKPSSGNVVDDAQWVANREKLWPAWNGGFGAARGNKPTRRQVTP